MSQDLIIKDSNNRDFFECKFIEDLGIVHGIWRGNMLEIEPAKRAANAFIEYIKKNNAKLALDDNRLGIGPWPDFQDWLNNLWIPTISETSLKKYAHIISPDKLAKGPAFEMFNQVRNDIIFATFDSYNSALEWLKSD